MVLAAAVGREQLSAGIKQPELLIRFACRHAFAMMVRSIGEFFQLLVQEFPHLLYMFLSRANVANRKP